MFTLIVLTFNTFASREETPQLLLDTWLQTEDFFLISLEDALWYSNHAGSIDDCTSLYLLHPYRCMYAGGVSIRHAKTLPFIRTTYQLEPDVP